MHDLDPTILDAPTLATLLNSHANALKASTIVFEKTVSLAMAASEYGGKANRVGFQEWAVENMACVNSWRETPELRRAYKILHAEAHRRWGKDQSNG
jgi:hypothetical protein